MNWVYTSCSFISRGFSYTKECAVNAASYICKFYGADRANKMEMLGNTKDQFIFESLKTYIKLKSAYNRFHIRSTYAYNTNSYMVNRNILRVNFLMDNKVYNIDVPFNRRTINMYDNIALSKETGDPVILTDRHNGVPLLVDPAKYGSENRYVAYNDGIVHDSVHSDFIGYI